jgi:hypothetical protein
LPSGDSIDVLFYLSHRIHAVEVKPASSSKQDIARGLFQCVKYRAVLQAEAGYRHDKRRITVCLVLGGLFPKDLIPLRNSLEVAVIDSVLVTLSALETVAMPAPESAIHSLERGSRRQLSKK